MDRPSPLRTLCILANPVDLPRFDDGFLWQEINEVLQPFQERGSVLFERLLPPTSGALRNSLASTPWNVLHLVVHAQENVAARYCKIAMQIVDGHAGNVTAQAFAAMLAPCTSLTLVVLQSPDQGSLCFDIAGDELLGHGTPAVVIVPRLNERAQKLFLTRLYSGLLLGLSAGELASHIAAAHSADTAGLERIRILGRDMRRPLFAAPSALIGSGVVETTPSASTLVPPWQETLRRKRDADTFDVFLCHNSADKPSVRRISQRLKESGILPWLDVEELPPGQPWQPLLERQIKNIRSAVVCFGAAGIGPWQEREMYGFLNAFVKRGLPVIPVLLPDAPFAPELPVFLAEMTWVDFRSIDSDPLTRLIWGITGKRPDFER